MFKRRIVILGAAGFLALAGLGGSALAAANNSADDPGAVDGTVTCTTSDGQTLHLQAAVPVTIDKDGKIKQGDPSDLPPPGAVMASPATPATTLPSGAPTPTAGAAEIQSFAATETQPGEKAEGGFMMKQEDGKVTQRLDAAGVPPKDGVGKAFTVKCVKDQ
ncbi:hypothetical protein [Nonomuraea sediminis]|uniref:hypothetical protein n=1 Tax=Nonomuraea sediminis TaxID=2835864 RepID=UPI001BDC9323|nr:hypothetical protein [Nonomuraea sediminis]